LLAERPVLNKLHHTPTDTGLPKQTVPKFNILDKTLSKTAFAF